MIVKRGKRYGVSVYDPALRRTGGRSAMPEKTNARSQIQMHLVEPLRKGGLDAVTP